MDSLRVMVKDKLAVDLTVIVKARELLRHNQVAFTMGGVKFTEIFELGEDWKIAPGVPSFTTDRAAQSRRRNTAPPRRSG